MKNPAAQGSFASSSRTGLFGLCFPTPLHRAARAEGKGAVLKLTSHSDPGTGKRSLLWLLPVPMKRQLRAPLLQEWRAVGGAELMCSQGSRSDKMLGGSRNGCRPGGWVDVGQEDTTSWKVRV